ncbi:MAG: translocation/assembly module TamB domain-containing protein [Paracoccaceae bacterium]|nr:translocation/assembly module TamB domain-containing protein [Paracoccaceae bacterium]
MRRAHAYLAGAALALALPVLAQEGDDRGFLTGYIEENLSGAGREVRLEGFAGALSSRATFDALTIADGAGVWLTIRDGAISWNRSALLRGRVEIGELTAAGIEVARRPEPEADPGLPDPEARPFRLPELPVSVEIGSIQAESVQLGAPVLGTEVIFRLDGSLRLEAGDGAATLAVARTDGTAGALTLDAGFVNATQMVNLDLALSEPEGGIAATLLNLPGRPSMELAVRGEGPLSDLTADIALASAGEPRLSGQARLSADTAADPPSRSFELDLAGDLAPLFLPEYRPFFGPDVRLAARGARTEGGETRLDELSVEAAVLSLDGRLTLAADGLPQDFAFDARIAAPGGGPVRLPVAGPIAEVEEARIEVAFDATQGDSWQGAANLRGFRLGSDLLGEARLTAEGEISRAGGEGAGRSVGASVGLEAREIALADPALAEAVGDTLDAAATLLWREGEPLALSNVTAETGNARLVATGTIGALAEGLPFAVRGSANLADLSVFSALAGRPIGGRLVLALNGTTNLLDGRFDLRASGVGRALSAGIEPFDRAVAGQSRVGLDARRDETGLTLRRFEISTETARITAAGALRAGATEVGASARLEEVGHVIPGLVGPAAARAQIRETGPGIYDLSASAEGPGEASLVFAGLLSESAQGALSAEGRLTASAARLSAYAELAQRPLRGAMKLTAEGEASLADQSFDLSLDLTGEDLALGQPTVDRLLGGTASLSASARREGDTTTVRRFEVSTREISAEATGSLGRVAGRIDGEARLRDLAVLAPDFPGPLAVTGTLSRAEDGGWGTDLQATGPGGTTATVAGRLAPDFATADLALTGEAPLGLANAAIAPRAVRGRASFDLRLSGRPSPDALSGRIATSSARLVAPTFGVAVDGIEGAVTLSGGAAAVDLAGAVEGGGRVTVGGSVGLAAPNAAELRIGLAGARIADPELFETDVSGTLSVTGPLQGAGLISGALDLGTTEIRVAATGLGTGDVPEGMRHRNEPTLVRATRAHAGLLETGANGLGSGRPFALDLLIRAPNRIFLRGRGLDAELGGALRLSGTTAGIIPQGQFDLLRGRLDILGRRLAFDEGLARLEGSFDPYIRLVAVTEAEEITVRVVVEGPASEPEIRFESSPELPEDEVLARLFFGRGLSELSPLQAARLASAVAQLSGRGGSGLVDRLRQNFGLDDLDITTDADGGTAVRAGRYLSENVYTEVTVGSQGKSDISINLDLSRSLTVKGKVDSEGESGVGIFFERDY